MHGQATTQAKRQVNAAVTKATNDNLKTLFGTKPASSRSKPKRDS